MTDFLHKFACFDCKIAFKRRAKEDTSTGTAHLPHTEIVHNCPNCDYPMAFMGRNFATPAKSNSSEWVAVQALWEAGFRYVGNGFHNDSPLPQRKSAVQEFIKANPNHAQRVGEPRQWRKNA